MTRPVPAFECDNCGACCRTFPVFASAADAAREPRITAEAVPLEPWLRNGNWAHRLFPLPFHDACCFLDGDSRCTVYPTRPEVCRLFAAGSEQCQEARARSGIAPLEPLPVS